MVIMEFRTDLALENKEELGGNVPRGVTVDELSIGLAKITRIRVENEEGAAALSRPKGNYITIEVPPFSDTAGEIDERLTAVSTELAKLLPEEGEILVAGLGNSDITPDALGPKAAARVLATRHISGELARSAGLGDLRKVSVVSPGVLGQTGIETGELLAGIAEKTHPAAVIAVDALASRRLSRLGCTIQISDTGISPGSGVGNHRQEISRKTLGVPVIAVGVPTVVDAATLVCDLAGATDEERSRLKAAVEPRGASMVVTPREIDLLIDRAADMVSLGINQALHPHILPEDMKMLVG